MNRRELPGKRLSRAHFQTTDSPRADFGGKAFMLWRDLQNGMMRFAGGLGNVHVRLEPADDRIEEWVVGLVDIGQFTHGSLAGALPAFVEQVANHLGYEGEGFFEIVTGEGDEKPPPAILAPLPSGVVKHRGSEFLQVLPETDRAPGQPEATAIPASRMWHIKLPRELGTPREHRAMLAALSRQEPIAGFALQDGRLGTGEGYEFGVHHRASDIATERATKAWGTIPSLQQIAGTTEFYYIGRQLQFLRAQALVREHIVTGLNELLTRFGVTVRIRVDGLPTAAVIGEYIAKLEKGETSFTKALEACRPF